MMSKFKIGDICVLCNILLPEHSKYNGEEVTIAGLPGQDKRRPDCYYIKGRIDAELTTGQRWVVPEKFLKLKEDGDNLDSTLSKQQLNKTVSWDDCAWRPRELVE